MTPLRRGNAILRPGTCLSAVLRLPASCRSFHATQRVQFLEAFPNLSHSLLESLHSATGLPWAYTIPLSALLIRSTLILPLSIYVRRCNQQQVALFPLIHSWRHNLRKDTMKEVGHRGPVVAQSNLVKKVRAKRREIYKRWGCQLWKNFLPVLQLPVFLVFIEAIRKMCGQQSGLFGMFTERIVGERAVLGKDVTLTAEGLVSSPSIPVEASLATEGTLWFPNLLLPDPQLCLPFTLSAVILLNLYHTGKRASSATGDLVNEPNRNAKPNIWQTRLRRGLGVFALAIGPLTIHVPSAMLVYWISSSLFAWIQGLALDRWMPVGRSIVPCEPKRPLRFGIEQNLAERK